MTPLSDDSKMLGKMHIAICYCTGCIVLTARFPTLFPTTEKCVRFSFALTHLIAFSVAMVWLPDRRLVVIRPLLFSELNGFYCALTWCFYIDAVNAFCMDAVRKVRWCRRSQVYCSRIRLELHSSLRCKSIAFWFVCWWYGLRASQQIETGNENAASKKMNAKKRRRTSQQNGIGRYCKNTMMQKSLENSWEMWNGRLKLTQ